MNAETLAKLMPSILENTPRNQGAILVIVSREGVSMATTPNMNREAVDVALSAVLECLPDAKRVDPRSVGIVCGCPKCAGAPLETNGAN